MPTKAELERMTTALSARIGELQAAKRLMEAHAAAEIAERDRTINEQATAIAAMKREHTTTIAALAALERRRVDLIALPVAAELAGIEYATALSWVVKGLVSSAEKRGGRRYVNLENLAELARMHFGRRSFSTVS